MTKIIAAFIMCAALLAVLPGSASAAHPDHFILSPGYIWPIGSIDSDIYAMMFFPKGWTSTSFGNSMQVTKDFPGLNVQASITTQQVDIQKIDQALLRTKGKNMAWVMKNYVPKVILTPGYESKLTTRRITFDGVPAMFYKYEFDGSTYIKIAFVKFGNLYMTEAQAPTSEWKSVEAGIMMSLGSVSVRKLALATGK